MIWRGSFRYSFWSWDSFPEQHSFPYLPTKTEKEALVTALEYFLRGEVPPEEEKR